MFCSFLELSAPATYQFGGCEGHAASPQQDGCWRCPGGLRCRLARLSVAVPSAAAVLLCVGPGVCGPGTAVQQWRHRHAQHRPEQCGCQCQRPGRPAGGSQAAASWGHRAACLSHCCTGCQSRTAEDSRATEARPTSMVALTGLLVTMAPPGSPILTHRTWGRSRPVLQQNF